MTVRGAALPSPGQAPILSFTDSSGTPGNATINTPRGRCSIAAAGTTVTITNSLVTAASTVLCVISSNDATSVLKNCVPGAGSFVITLNAAATATTNIDFTVTN